MRRIVTDFAVLRHGFLPLLAVFCVVACGQDPATQSLKIATDATFAPFHWVDEDGQVTGFDIELARKVAEEIGAVADIRVLEYESLFTGLIDSSHDLVAATTGITGEREARYLLSRPYFTTCQVAVVRSSDNELQSIADLTGARIGSAGSGTSARAMATIDGRHIAIGDGTGPALLVDNAIDAWIVDEFDGVQVARESGNEFRVLSQPVAHEQYALVMPRGREELKSQVDEALELLEESGWTSALALRFGLNGDPDWPVNCR